MMGHYIRFKRAIWKISLNYLVYPFLSAVLIVYITIIITTTTITVVVVVDVVLLSCVSFFLVTYRFCLER